MMENRILPSRAAAAAAVLLLHQVTRSGQIFIQERLTRACACACMTVIDIVVCFCETVFWYKGGGDFCYGTRTVLTTSSNATNEGGGRERRRWRWLNHRQWQQFTVTVLWRWSRSAKKEVSSKRLVSTWASPCSRVAVSSLGIHRFLSLDAIVRSEVTVNCCAGRFFAHSEDVEP